MKQKGVCLFIYSHVIVILEHHVDDHDMSFMLRTTVVFVAVACIMLYRDVECCRLYVRQLF